MIPKVVYHIFSLPVKALLTLLWLRISGRDFLISGSCHSCGQCCRSINLKYYKGWIRKEQQFDELLQEHPEYEIFHIDAKDHEGFLQFNCSKFDPEAGCLDYANRLDVCKRYPSKMLLLRGDSLISGCGYSVKEGIPFKKHLTAEMRRKEYR
ncbi:YkgJ family cysteine cluster protein [Desulfopila inferna]|uniref:YkgJ family cysteine cluster protein n=1 Tax=Desulfopila inferna TaxID=468528 RepID=UPI001962E25C|nr:YkgJ family cysteine cluster protein [Desulfopila inferna]MBM9602733.1 YkgJ family cysteine cluster protein [Desulfopila inferna]